MPFFKLQKLDLKPEAQCSWAQAAQPGPSRPGGQFLAPQAAPCLENALTGNSIFLIQLQTLSTTVQSLEPSIQGSTKLGLTKFDFYLSFRYLDSIQ
jgi:hypothetical protein